MLLCRMNLGPEIANIEKGSVACLQRSCWRGEKKKPDLKQKGTISGLRSWERRWFGQKEQETSL